jgi:anti-anti-sigma regulatory factor
MNGAVEGAKMKTEIVKLAGELTLRTAVSTKLLLDTAIATAAGGSIVVDIGPDHAADLSLAQLLLSAQRTAARSQTGFSLQGNVSGSLRSVLERGGFVNGNSRDDIFTHEGSIS